MKRKVYHNFGMARIYKKKTWKKKSSVKRSGKNKGKGQYGVRYMKLRQHVSVNANPAGMYEGDFSVRNPSTAQDWSSCAELFDEYQVSAYKIQFVPHVPAGNSSTKDYRPLYLIFDSNSTSSPVTNVNECLQYENLRVMNLFRPWKFYMKVPKITSSENMFGYQPTSSPSDAGRLVCYADNLDASGFYGDVIITHYIKFRARK